MNRLRNTDELGTMPPRKVTLMLMQEKSLDHVYCASCHLATTTWRKKCIHCSKPWSRTATGVRVAMVERPEKTA